MARLQIIFVLGVVAATFSLVSAISEEDRKAIKDVILPIIIACGQEFGVSEEDVLAAKKANNSDAIKPCYFACFFKKIGYINDQGLYDAAAAKEGHAKYIHDKDALAKFDAVSDICSKVNDQPVTDGVKGCERSKMVAQCLNDNKAAFTPLGENDAH